MIYSELINKAMIVAYEAHHGQKDRAGVPYIYHPINIAEQMDTEEETIAALLHDVVEDTPWTFEQLENQGFSTEVMQTLKLLTHYKEVDYMDYVRKIAFSSNQCAKKVKMADLKHNSDLSRYSRIDEQSRKRIEKYRTAIKILENNY